MILVAVLLLLDYNFGIWFGVIVIILNHHLFGHYYGTICRLLQAALCGGFLSKYSQGLVDRD